jgi:hypothetical protein
MTLSRAKSIAIDWLAAFSNWLGDITTDPKVSIDDPEFGDGWRDHVRWQIERITDPLWSWLWDGSDCEIESALHGEVPWQDMNDRQRAACMHPVCIDQADAHWIVRDGQIIEVGRFEWGDRSFYVRADTLQIVD